MSLFNWKKKQPEPVALYTKESEDFRNQFESYFSIDVDVECIERVDRGKATEHTQIFTADGTEFNLAISRAQHAALCRKFEISDIRNPEAAQ